MTRTVALVATALVLLKTVHGYVNVAPDVQCGLGPRGSKIVGGTEAERGEFPFIVSLRHSARDRHFCGGAILDRTHIITAAHCIERGFVDHVRIAVREHNVRSPEKGADSYNLKSETVVKHEDFDILRLNDDVAVIKLREPIAEWDNLTNPVCLPEPDGSDEVVGEKAIVIGWGRLSEDGLRPDVLQKAKVPIVDNAFCKTKLKKWFNIKSGQLCAGYPSEAIDSCQGDSGGPLVVRRQGRYVLIGIVSAGVGCARPGLPGVYTRVSHYHDWILAALSR